MSLVPAIFIFGTSLACAVVLGRLALRHGRRWPLAVSTLIGWSPLISGAFAALVSGAFGCNVNEGFPVPCPGPFGIDLGGLLYSTFVFAWVTVLTLPVILGTALVWLLLLGRWLLGRARRGRHAAGAVVRTPPDG